MVERTLVALTSWFSKCQAKETSQPCQPCDLHPEECFICFVRKESRDESKPAEKVEQELGNSERPEASLI